jgi:hypothetical protein
MDTKTPIETALGHITEGEAQYRRQRSQLQAHKKLINKLLHKLAGCDDLSVYADGYEGCGTVTVSCNMLALDSFKAPRLTRVLEQFCGDEWRPETREWPSSLNMTYIFSMPSPAVDGLTVRVKVDAYARNDSPTCKKVLVGKKRVSHVEKTYRMECN